MPRRRKIRAEDLFQLKLLDSPNISPDGSRIVYALKWMDAKANRYLSNLWLVAAGGGQPRQLTRGQQLDSAPVWSPSGRHIAFLSNRDEQSQVWIIPADGGEARALTKLEGSISGLAFSPDGKELLFLHWPRPKVDPEEYKKKANYKHITQLPHKMDGYGFYPAGHRHVYICSTRAGRTRQLTQGDFNVDHAIWSPDGRQIAYVANTDPERQHDGSRAQIYVLRATGGRPRAVTTRQGFKWSLVWGPEGRSLLFSGHFGKAGEWIKHPSRIYEVGLRQERYRDLTPWMDDWPVNDVLSDTVMGFAETLWPYRANGQWRIAFVLNEKGGARLFSIPHQGGSRRDKPRLEFGGDVSVYHTSVTEDGSAALAVAHMMDAGDVYRLRLDGSENSRRLTRGNAPWFNRLQLSEPEEHWFRNGSHRIQGWILKPPGFRKDRRYPMLLQIHGGPMAQYGYTFFHEMHLLAAQGYVVVFSNPRGSTGYGTDWVKCISGKWGGVDYEDLMAVTNTMARRPYVDARRLGVLGGSYGGFMTTWILGHSKRFRAGVTMRQAGNRLIQFGASDFGWYEYYQFGGFPWEKPMQYLKRSPNFYAKDIRAPLLIIHSENDLRCPIAQADELFTSLKFLGKTVEYVRFEGESHGLSRGGRPQNRLERLRRIVDWFDRYL